MPAVPLGVARLSNTQKQQRGRRHEMEVEVSGAAAAAAPAAARRVEEKAGMKTRAPQLFLEEALFDANCPATPAEGGYEMDQSLLLQNTHSSTLPRNDKFERCSRVKELFLLPPHHQVTELANALLRQFTFRVYRKWAPDIIHAFNNAFPRSTHSLTCKTLVHSLLDEMGLLEGRSPYADDGVDVAEQLLSQTQTRSQISDCCTVTDIEGEETVLELLVRNALRKFHERYHDRRCETTSGMNSLCEIETCSIHGSCTNGSRGRHTREKVDTSESCFTGHKMPPMEVQGMSTSALCTFFNKYPTENEQVFVLAATLLRQHASHLHSVALESSILRDAVNLKDAVGGCDDSSSDTAMMILMMIMSTVLRNNHKKFTDCESLSSFNDEEDTVRHSAERIAFIELLKNVQQETVCWQVLWALFGEVVWTVCSTMYERTLGTEMNPITTELISRLSGSHCIGNTGLTLETGNENCNFHENILLNEGRWQFPSLLCLYLESHMQDRASLMEGVHRRMIRVDPEYAQLNTASTSLRDSTSSLLFSPLLPSLRFSFTTPKSQPLNPSSLRIVSVHSLENMTRIGHGSSGELFAIPRLDTGELVAVKCIYITEESRKHVEKEISVLRRIIGLGDEGSGKQHTMEKPKAMYRQCVSNIIGDQEEEEDKDEDNDARAVVRCYDVFFDSARAFIVMELMDSGSLMDALNARSGRGFTEEECCAITFQVLHGLRYLHDTVRQLHRDLKPHNILLNRGTGSVKLTDFGLSSSRLQSMGFDQCGTYVGTLAYMSPARVDADSVYGKESDFWSLGITLLQLALGKLPFVPTIFTIASFRTHPPRLPQTSAVIDKEEECTSHEVCSYDNQSSTSSCSLSSLFSSSTTKFSSAFQDFVAVLLPALQKDCCGLMAQLGDDDSLPSCAQMCSGQRNGDADDDGTLAMNSCDEDALGISDVVNHTTWKPHIIMSRKSSMDFKNVGSPSPQPLLLPLECHPRGSISGRRQKQQQQHQRVDEAGYDEERDNKTLQKDLASTIESLPVMELTATALLRHPWLEGMTWKKSTAVISCVSLEALFPRCTHTSQ